MKPDLIHGYKAIAAHLGITVSLAKSEADKGWLPTFRQGTGNTVYARPSALDRYAEDRKARLKIPKGGRATAETVAVEQSQQRGRAPITDPSVIAARIADRASQVEMYRARKAASLQAQREADQAQREANGILYGMDAIAEYLGLPKRVASHLHDKGNLPTFRLGSRICARRIELDGALSANAAEVPKGSRRYGPRDPTKRAGSQASDAGGGSSRAAPSPASAAASPALLYGHRAIAAHLGIPAADVTRLDAERRLPTYQDDGCTVASTAALDHWNSMKGGR